MHDLNIPKKVIISRTDAIGDVVLTLPMAGILKSRIPGIRIIFFGKTYTQSVISCSVHVDEFLNFDTFEKLDPSSRAGFLRESGADAIIHVYPRSSIARAGKAAGIKFRVGTTNRLYHWWTCNKLVPLGRRNSSLHEAQLNLQLLRIWTGEQGTNIADIPPFFGLKQISALPEKFSALLSPVKFNVILHPKTNTSAREWSLDRFSELIRSLPSDRFRIFITGTQHEKAELHDWCRTLPAHVTDLTGGMTLEELISFIQHVDGMVAASTGPLHLAAAFGKYTLGIFPPIHPMHPGRWAPLGMNAEFIVVDKSCSDCRSNPKSCHCMNEISASRVAKRVLDWESKKKV